MHHVLSGVVKFLKRADHKIWSITSLLNSFSGAHQSKQDSSKWTWVDGEKPISGYSNFISSEQLFLHIFQLNSKSKLLIHNSSIGLSCGEPVSRMRLDGIDHHWHSKHLLQTSLSLAEVSARQC